MNVRTYIAQRVSAIILVPFILTHLVLIIMAVQNGLSAEEILGRTRGSAGWAIFYGIFLLAVSVHATIGVGTVLAEWTSLRPRNVKIVSHLFGAALLILGFRAIIAVI